MRRLPRQRVKREPPTSAELARVFRPPAPEPSLSERLYQLESDAHHLRPWTSASSLKATVEADPAGPSRVNRIYGSNSRTRRRN
jgi:hypothetical protein